MRKRPRGELSVKTRIENMNKAFYVLRGIQFYSGVRSKIESVIGRCVFKTDGFRHNGWAVPSYQVFAYSGDAEMTELKSRAGADCFGIRFMFPVTDPNAAEYMRRFCVSYSDSAAGIVDKFAEIVSSALGLAVLSSGGNAVDSGTPPELAAAASKSKSEQKDAAFRYIEVLRSRFDLELSMRGLC